MSIQTIVEDLLNEQHKSKAWLSRQIKKTEAGMAYSFKVESIKYRDLKILAAALEISPALLFEDGYQNYKTEQENAQLKDPAETYQNPEAELKNCREKIKSMKSQLIDKNKLIAEYEKQLKL